MLSTALSHVFRKKQCNVLGSLQKQERKEHDQTTQGAPEI